MKRKENSKERDLPNPSDLSEVRCRRRLREILGINAPGITVILRLRRQVLALEARVRELEAQLTSLETSRNSRLTRYRETYSEASWQDLFEEDGNGEEDR